jgi:hypothetical protein
MSKWKSQSWAEKSCSEDDELRPVQFLTFQISCDFGELGEGGLEVFDDLDGDDVGSRDLHRV